MPNYYFCECHDRHLGHPGPANLQSIFADPCFGVRLKIMPDKSTTPEHLQKLNAHTMKKVVHPCSYYQENCLISADWLPRLGVDGALLLREKRTITRMEHGRLVRSEERVSSLGTKICVCNGASSSEAEKLSPRSIPLGMEFLVAENLPREYICLGWQFIEFHFHSDIYCQIDPRRRTIYRLTAKDPSNFCVTQSRSDEPVLVPA